MTSKRPRALSVVVSTLGLALALLVPARGAGADEDTAVQRFTALSIADAETAAVAHSPDVATARAAVDAAGAALAQTTGTNGISALIGFESQPQGSGTPIQWQQRLGSYQLQTTLDDVAALSPLTTQARAALAQSLTDELVAERTEKLKVIGLYYAAVQALVQRDAADDALASAEDFESDVTAKFGAAKAERIDLLRAEVATAKARAVQATAVAADANAADALAREVDRPVADLRATEDDPVPISSEVLDPDTAIARAFAFRPELQSADRAVEQAQYARNAALRQAIPPVTLTGGYENGSDSGVQIGGAMFSATVAIPLSGVGAAKVHAQDAAIKTAVAHRESVRRALAIEVGTAARTAAQAVIARSATSVEVTTSGDELALASAAAKAVPSSGAGVEVARQIHDQAVSDDIAALYTLVQAQATLNVELNP